jgi:hypothetical protein
VSGGVYQTVPADGVHFEMFPSAADAPGVVCRKTGHYYVDGHCFYCDRKEPDSDAS